MHVFKNVKRSFSAFGPIVVQPIYEAAAVNQTTVDIGPFTCGPTKQFNTGNQRRETSAYCIAICRVALSQSAIKWHNLLRSQPNTRRHCCGHNS